LLIGLVTVFIALALKWAALIVWPEAGLAVGLGLSVLAAFLAGFNVLQVRALLKDHQRETERLFTGEERFVRDCTVAMCAPPLGLSDPSAQISDNHAKAEARLRGLEPALALAKLYNRHSRDLVAGRYSGAGDGCARRRGLAGGGCNGGRPAGRLHGLVGRRARAVHPAAR
jgi:hypothetical protein